jgi:G3E family GTPase
LRHHASLKAYASLGPTFAGKTTLNAAILKAGQLPPERTAYVLNDDGTVALIDRSVVEKKAKRFKALTAGCFTCEDPASTIKTLTDICASGEVDWVMLDPLGFIQGHELPNLLRPLGIELRTFTLVSVATFVDDLEMGYLPSQLRHATLGVGLTHFEKEIASLEDPRLERVLNYIGFHAPGQQIFLLPEGNPLPATIAAELQAPSTNCSCGHAHEEHGHEHHHAHGHVHEEHEGHHEHDSIKPYGYYLRPDTSLEALQTSFGEHWRTVDAKGAQTRPGIFRVKAIVGGYQWHGGHGQWQRGIPDSNPASVSFYAKDVKIDPVLLEGLIIPQDTAECGTVQTLRSHVSGVEESNNLVRHLLASVPKDLVISADGPVTNPHHLEELNQVRKRPGILPEFDAQAIRHRVGYYLKVLDELKQPQWQERPSTPSKMLTVAVGIGWFAKNKFEVLGNELLDSIKNRSRTIALFLFKGLGTIDRLHADDATARMVAGEVRDTISYLKDIGIGPEIFTVVIQHCIALADGRAEVQQVWESVLKI